MSSNPKPFRKLKLGQILPSTDPQDGTPWLDGNHVAAGSNTTVTPTITQHPQSTTVEQGTTATFTITATMATAYQWQVQQSGAGAWQNISGATSSSYSKTSPTVADDNTDKYRCIVTGTGASVTSNSATLTVTSATLGSGYDVWLIIGQSNATGTNNGLIAGQDDLPKARVKQWPFGGPSVGTVIDGVDEMWHQDYAIARPGNNVGFGPAFGKLLVDTLPSNRTVLLVPAGWGGTQVINWIPDTGQSTPAGGKLLPPALTKVDEALALPGENVFRGVLYHQGEGDQNTSPATFATYLNQIVAYFRNTYGGVFLVGELRNGWLADVAGLKAGSVSSRTNATDGNISGLPTGHGFQSGDSVNLYWDGGSRTGCQAYDIQTNRVSVTAGSGTDLPANGVAVTIRKNWTANGNLINDKLIAMPGATGNYQTAFWYGQSSASNDIHYSAAEQRANAAKILAAYTLAKANVANVAPAKVTGLAATAIGAKSVQLHWDHPASRVTKFQVKWRAAGGTFATVDTASRDCYYYFRTLDPATTYEFKVFATNETGNGTDSDVLTVIVNVPNAPTGLTAGTPTTSAVPLSWTAPASGAVLTDYVVQYKESTSGTWLTYSDGASTTASATVTGLTQDTSYDFKVAASNASGTGTYTSTVTVSTAAATTNKWDTATASSQLVFDETNRRVIGNNTGANSFYVAKSTLSFASGKRYVEIIPSTIAAGNSAFQIGLAKVSNWNAGLGAALGQITNSAGFYGAINSTIADGFTVANEASGLFSGLATTDVLQIAFDYTAGKAWIGKNNTWSSSGNPATGANPWLTWTPSGAVAIAIMDFYSTASGRSPGLRLAATQVYLPPTGFTEING